jgi:microcystin-dependent protein
VSDPFVAEIRTVGFNFAPTGWATCDGQILPISQNTALFSLLGTYYGGDGKSTFALPNLQGSFAMGAGQGGGLSERYVGEQGGEATVTLLQSEMPAHIHRVQALDAAGNNPAPPNLTLSRYPGAYQSNSSSGLTAMSPNALPVAGSSLPHNNLQPYLTLLFVIAMQGIFPPRG